MILRGEKISHQALLTMNRELLPLSEREQKFHALFEQEVQKAFEKGKKEGVKEGKKQTSDLFAHLQELLNRVAHRLLEQKQKLLHQLKPEIVEFALCCSKAVIQKELKEAEVLVELIHSLLNKISHYETQEKWHLFLAPQDLVKLEQGLDRHASFIGSKSALSLHADPQLPEGDFRLESEKTLLKFSLDREIEQIRQHVCSH